MYQDDDKSTLKCTHPVIPVKFGDEFFVCSTKYKAPPQAGPSLWKGPWRDSVNLKRMKQYWSGRGKLFLPTNGATCPENHCVYVYVVSIHPVCTDCVASRTTTRSGVLYFHIYHRHGNWDTKVARDHIRFRVALDFWWRNNVCRTTLYNAHQDHGRVNPGQGRAPNALIRAP